jgi:hypothetical protein
MPRFLVSLICAGGCLFLGGCLFYHRSESSFTNQAVTDPILAERITVGESTTTDVKRLYGEPLTVDHREGTTHWHYGVTITEESKWLLLFVIYLENKHTRDDKLTFVFDKAGVLQEMRRRPSSGFVTSCNR